LSLHFAQNDEIFCVREKLSRNQPCIKTKLSVTKADHNITLDINCQRRIIIMARAKARHILVPSEEECLNLKSQIEAGEDFATAAQNHSQCPSGQQGGDLGEFGRGQMVPEFDEAVFNGEVGKVLGPIKTQFGYHLLEVTERS
jgi:peptidyl-prolyl cis-trans isomerase C